MSRDAVAYQLRTPATWRSTDLTVIDEVGEVGLARAIEAVGLAGGPAAPTGSAHDARGLVRDAVRAARAGGGIELYVFQAWPDGRAVTSTLVVFARTADSDQDHADVDFLALRLRLEPAAGGETGRDVSVVRLAHAGEAVRVERRRSVAVEGAEAGGEAPPIASSELQFLVPVPGTRAVLGLSFATPNVTLAPAFARLWEAVAGTLRFVDGSLGRRGSAERGPERNCSASRPRSPEST